MKIVLSILFLYLCINCNGQDCLTLDKFDKFHGLKFGAQLPDSIKKYCWSNNEDNYTDFFFGKDSIYKVNKSDYIKYDSWFHFTGVFESIFFSVWNNKLFSVTLYKDLDYFDSTSIANNKIPNNYNSVADEISSIFGTKTKETTSSGLIHELTYTWECDKMKIELFLNYGVANYIQLCFTDKGVEKQQKLAQYSQ